ncbi:amidase [Zoogloea sp. LCSB751]|uniref:amidase n=1 Tax=Zoogloea sp. LCSB751 TaxID=1965277 RepID=UPI0009A4EBFD|nr:amidase [Zoogloea sp. LCSB751]
MPAPAFPWTASSAVEALRTGAVSATELLEQCLERVTRFNPHLNALVTVDAAGARKAAQAADARIAAGERLPLLGVPISVKDSFATQGLRTTASYRPLAEYVPDKDASVVGRLREAGAVIVGKSNLPELAGAPHCWSPLFGLTRNPWDPTLTPGGSSGGAAVAVAAGFSLLELGSDIAGSIRIPAAYCGVTGLKATENRIPRTGHIPHLPEHLRGERSVRHMLSFGLLARSVADLQLGYGLIAGPDGCDMEVPPWQPDQLPALAKNPLRLVLWEEGCLPLCERTRAALAGMVGKLEAAGHSVERRAPPDLDLRALHTLFGAIGGVEIGLGMPAWQRRLLPALRHLLPRTETLGRAFAAGLRFDMADYNRALNAREAAIASLERFLADFDALLSPVACTVAYPGRPMPAWSKPPAVQVDGRKLPYLEATIGWTAPFSLTGSPVVTLPLGIEAGLPVGVQVVGRRWQDEALLAVATRLEGVLGGFVSPPPLEG